jgi:hypothetical protein
VADVGGRRTWIWRLGLAGQRCQYKLMLQTAMIYDRVIIALYLFDGAMILSENRYPLFRIMLYQRCSLHEFNGFPAQA